MSGKREIHLKRGEVTIVDADMYDQLAKFRWYSADGYAVRWDRAKGRVWMHREVNHTPEGMETDHIDGDKLNNTRANLRTATRAQNNCNVSPRGTSPFLGVSWYPQTQRWRSQIRSKGKTTHLGFFANECEAARAYDDAAHELHGRFARLNFPARLRAAFDLDEGSE